MPLFHSITLLDWLALSWFILAWGGYGWYSEHRPGSAGGLIKSSHPYRLAWADALLRREQRVMDAALIGNLMNSVTFYANTTIYILAGLFALLGTLDKFISFAADLPFVRNVSHDLLELKLFLLLAVFVFAYFKFTWSMRQFNLLSILVGAAPAPDAGPQPAFVEKMAAVNSLAGDEFNRGIRAYYFGIAAVTWMIQPWLCILVTTLVLIVLYRRDFSSELLQVIRQEPPV